MRILQDFVLVGDPVPSEVTFLATAFFLEERVDLAAEDERHNGGGKYHAFHDTTPL
jgi:hypothetical protein